MQTPRALRTLVCALLIIGLFAGPHAVSRVAAEGADDLRVVGPQGETTPVVNEKRKLRLRVVDGAGNTVAVASWDSDSLDVAKVSRKGVLKGRRFGFATVTAHTARGDVQAFAVVVRVSDRQGERAKGDTKSDTSGNVYLSDPQRNVIYRARGLRSDVFAGSADGDAGYRDATGTNARFNLPTGLGIDNRAEGGIFVADTENNCIRRVGFDGKATTALGDVRGGRMADDVTPLAQAAMRGPRGVASVGRNFFFTDTGNNAIYYADYTGGGEVQLLAGQPGETGLANGRGRDARFSAPSGLAISSDGKLLAVADTGNNLVRLVSIVAKPDGRLAGDVTTLGEASSARGTTLEASWRDDRGEDAIAFDAPESVALDGAGNVYVIDAAGASVVTRPLGRRPQKVALAQPGSLGDPASVTISGTRALVLDRASATAAHAVKQVEVGPPAIDRLSQNSDLLAGGAEVVIDGSNFAPESRLTLGDAEVTDYQVVSARRIVFRVPPQNAIGGRTLSVITRGGVAQRQFHIVPQKKLADLAPGEITTVAGASVPYLGDGGQAVDPEVVVVPFRVTLGTDGAAYLSDVEHNRVRYVDPATGVLSTVAGNGTSEYSGDGGAALSAGIARLDAVALDPAGNLYFSDIGSYRVRRVDRITGTISTVVGSGSPEFGGDGGPASEAGIVPQSLAFDPSGDLFVVDDSFRVRRVSRATGIITTVAGNGFGQFDGDGGLATNAGMRPAGIAISATGDLYVSDVFNLRVRRIDAASGIIKTVAGNGTSTYPGDGANALDVGIFPSAIALDPAGDLFVASTSSLSVFRVDNADNTVTTVAGNGERAYGGDGKPARSVGLCPAGLALDGLGDLFIADDCNNRLLRVDGASNLIATVTGSGLGVLLGDGFPATSVSIRPEQCAVDADGNVSVTDYLARRVRRFDTSTGFIATVAGDGDPASSGDGGVATRAGMNPLGIALDTRGSLFVTDVWGQERTSVPVSHRIRRVDRKSSIIMTVAGSTDGGFAGDGGPAVDALLDLPASIAFDGAGNLYVADSLNGRVRRIDAVTGVITTVAGDGSYTYAGDGVPATETGLGLFDSIAVEADGTLYVADVLSHAVYRVDAVTGLISTVAGNGTTTYGGDGRPAIEVGIAVSSIAVDSRGHLFVAAGPSHAIYRVDLATGIITTLAGNGAVGNTGDGGPARAASLGATFTISCDNSGNVYVVDNGFGTVRVVRAGQ